MADRESLGTTPNLPDRMSSSTTASVAMRPNICPGILLEFRKSTTATCVMPTCARSGVEKNSPLHSAAQRETMHSALTGQRLAWFLNGLTGICPPKTIWPGTSPDNLDGITVAQKAQSPGSNGAVSSEAKANMLVPRGVLFLMNQGVLSAFGEPGLPSFGMAHIVMECPD